jgi:NAD(P)-dependent dehydrogenase (short-subunit alcohol dehydrogenase family)
VSGPKPLLAASELLRAGALEGRVIVVAASGGAFGGAILEACGALGARVAELDCGDEVQLAAAAGAIRCCQGAIDTLVCDGDHLYAGDGLDALRACVDRCWDATRAVANAAFIPDERGGKVMLVTPRPDGSRYALAAQAALENASRTLSIEWARYAIVTSALVPGAGSAPAEVAALAAFLASDAGDYYSGCAFKFGAAQA